MPALLEAFQARPHHVASMLHLCCMYGPAMSLDCCIYITLILCPGAGLPGCQGWLPSLLSCMHRCKPDAHSHMGMCRSMCVLTLAPMHTHVHTDAYTRTHAHTRTCARARPHVHAGMCARVHACAYTCTCAYTKVQSPKYACRRGSGVSCSGSWRICASWRRTSGRQRRTSRHSSAHSSSSSLVKTCM